MPELESGSPRRWEPEIGNKRHGEKIRKESKMADQKNLPFKFSKPKKSAPPAVFECSGCGRLFSASKNTVMVICPVCKKLTTARKIENE